jgi:hypothetical protein
MQAHLAPWTRLPSRQACYAVAPPYRPAFIEAIKARLPWGSSHWYGTLKIWAVEKSHVTTLATLLLEHFPKEERCQECLDGRPCPVWTEKDRIAQELKLGRLRSLSPDRQRSRNRLPRRRPRRSSSRKDV